MPASDIPEDFRKLSRFFPVIVLVPKSAVEDEAQKKPSRINLSLNSGLLSRKLMLKIRRTANGEVGFMVSGRMDSESIAELERLFRSEANGRHVILELKALPLRIKILSTLSSAAKRTESRPRIAQHTSVNGS
jgi:hypothetical protein